MTSIVPDILLISRICLGVRLFRIFPASITLAISASILMIRQTEKMMIRSRSPCNAEKAVALISQKKITFGLRVLIRKPDKAIFVKSVVLKVFTSSVAAALRSTFLKNI